MKINEKYKEIIQKSVDKIRHGKAQLLSDLEKFSTSSDRDELMRISNQYKDKELIYVPKVNNEETCDILIQTVGTRPQPILLSILMLRPKTVHLLHTNGSKDSADIIEQHKLIKKREIEIILHLVDEVDPRSIYSKIKTIRESIHQEKKVLMDPTSGRKAMVASAASAAFYYDIPMRYLLAYEKLGIVMPFSESLHSIDNPYQIYGDFHRQQNFSLLNSYLFSEAIKLNEQLNYIIVNPESRSFFQELKLLTELYQKWDNFEHSDPDNKENLASKMKFINEKIDKMNILNEETLNQIKQNVKFLELLEDTWVNGSENMDDIYRIVDLYCSAIRRKEQGRYDTAIAILFRLVEMIAIKIIKKFIKLPNKPRINEILHILSSGSKELQEINNNLLKKWKEVNGKSILNLIRYFEIIAEFPEYSSISEDYFTNQKLRETRNSSILAHGTKPVREDDFINLQMVIYSWLVKLSSDANKLIKVAKFPKFKDIR